MEELATVVLLGIVVTGVEEVDAVDGAAGEEAAVLPESVALLAIVEPPWLTPLVVGDVAALPDPVPVFPGFGAAVEAMLLAPVVVGVATEVLGVPVGLAVDALELLVVVGPLAEGVFVGLVAFATFVAGVLAVVPAPVVTLLPLDVAGELLLAVLLLGVVTEDTCVPGE